MDMNRKLFFTAFLMLLCSTMFGQWKWQAPAPNEFEHSMDVAAIIKINGVTDARENLELAAFCDGAVRGTTKTQKITIDNEEVAFAFITIYGNHNNDNIKFKLYVPSTNGTDEGKVLVTDYIVSFRSGSLIGNITPEVIDFYESHWSCDVVFNNTMTVGCIINIDGVPYEGTDVEIAAFCNGEVRGVGRPVYWEETGQYYTELIVGKLVVEENQGVGNEDNDIISFKLYHPEYGELNTDYTVQFKDGETIVDENNQAISIDFLNEAEAQIKRNGVYRYFTTLAEAVEKAKAGETIELLKDITATEVIWIEKSLTINGNGKKVESTANRVFRVNADNIEVTLNNVNMVNTAERVGTNDIRGISIDLGLAGVKLTLNDCSVDFTDFSANDWTYAVNVSGNGTGHTVTVNGGTYEGANVINVHGANNTVTVKDAVITSTYPNNDQYYGACIWVLQNQDSKVTATGNTFNGNNAIAFNLGTGTTLTESNNIDNTTICVAKIGSEYYTSLKDAFEVAQDGDEIKVLQNIALSESITNAKKVTLDLNGKTITGTDNATGSFGLITNKGELTITGNGKITLEATEDRDWNAYSSVISNTVGGKLTVENGTIEHLGGTDMAYGIDNLTNGKGTYAETVVNGGTVKSTYRAIRQFLNGVEADNILTVNGGTIEGANKSIWMQDPSAKANSGKLTVGAGASLKGDVYLSVTEGSTEWPVEVNVAVTALQDGYEVLTNGKEPECCALQIKDNAYVVSSGEARIGENYYTKIQDAVNAAEENDVVTIIKNVEYAINANEFTAGHADDDAAIIIAAGKKITINLNGKTISVVATLPDSATTKHSGAIINKGDLTIDDYTENKNGVIRFNYNGVYDGGNKRHGVVMNLGKLTVNAGTLENVTELENQQAIDNTNYGGTDVFVVINGGTIKSAGYYAIDMVGYYDFAPARANSVVVNGGTIDGGIYARIQANTNLSLNIKGGVIKSDFAEAVRYRVYYAGNTHSIGITGGDFSTTKDGAHVVRVQSVEGETLAGFISGGTYSQNVAEYLAAGFICEQNENGTYSVKFADYIVLPTDMDESNYEDKFGVNTVTDGTNYYKTMKAALEGIHLTGKNVLYCKPGANVGVMTHGHVCADLTVYGNDAFISGGEQDFELGQYNYCHNGSSTCSGVTSDLDFVVNYLHGSGAWGTHNTEYAFNITFNNCENMSRVYMNGTGGDNNINLESCSFTSNTAGNCKLYSNANGTINVKNCEFSNLDIAINLNHKAEGNQIVNIENTTFDKVGSSEYEYSAPVRVLSSVEGAESNVSITGCTFSNTVANSLSQNADILLDYAIGLTTAIVSNTNANVIVERENNISIETTTVEDQTYTFDNKPFVAQVGEVKYIDLQDAVNADGKVIILRNIVLTETLNIAAGKNITLDLAGYTISQVKTQTAGYQMILNDGNLTIEDSSAEELGKISYTDRGDGGEYVSNTITNRGTITVKGGTIENLSSATVANNGYPYAIDSSIWGPAAEVNTIVDGGKVIGQNYSAIRMRTDSATEAVNVTVTGGEIVGTIEVHNPSSTVAGKGKLTIRGGKLSNSGTANVLYFFGFGASAANIEVEVTGGEFTGIIKESTSYPIGNGFNKNFITGGTYSTDVTEFCAEGFICELNNQTNKYEVFRGLTGEGTNESPFLIKNIDDLVFFRDHVNAGETKYNAEGVYVALDANIDMTSVDWSVNIGDDCNATFDGIFDGKGFTLSNLNSIETAQKADGYICTGLFGAIAGNAVVKNFTIENVTIKTGDFTGNNVSAVVGFALNATGSIENVSVIGDININAPKATGVGAILGYDYYSPALTVNECVVAGNAGSAIVGKSYVGGVVGYASSMIALNENTVEKVSVTGTGSVGAIAGIMLAGGSADNNTVGNVALSATGELWANSAAVVAGTITSGSVTVANTTVQNVTANNAAASIVGGVLVEQPTSPIEMVQARIGNKYYSSFDLAYEAANENENTITILADFILKEPFNIEKAIKLDLNDKVVTGADGEIVFNVKAATEIVNGTVKGNKSGTSSGLIDIYANLDLNGVTIETSKIYALRFKAGGCVATLTDCNVTGAFKGYGNSVWTITSGTYKASSTSITDQINGTASVSGGTFHYEIKETVCAPGYVVVNNGDGTWTVKYAPAAFVDANNNGTLDEGEAVYGNLDQLFANHKEGDVHVVLTANIVANAKVDTDADAHYYFTTNVAEGVTMDFLFAGDWNYIQKMSIGENITLNASYLLAWTTLEVSGTINTGYAYFMGANVTINEGAVLNANVQGSDATVQVKGGTTLTVSGTVNTNILNVWSGESKLIVDGENANVNASWIDIWDGTPSVSVQDGATLDADKMKASRGGTITVNNATIKSEIELGHNNESVGKLTEIGESTIDGKINLSVVGSTVVSDGGLDDVVTTDKEGYMVVYNDGVYSIEMIVAMIGETSYATLQSAFNAAVDGDEIVIAQDITITEAFAGYSDGTYTDGIRYNGDKSFTVNFNTKTVTDDGCVNDYLIYINNLGIDANEITFTNGTIVSKNGCWSTVCVGASTSENATTLNLEGMTIINSNGSDYNGNLAVRVRGNNIVNVNDYTTIISDGASYGIGCLTDGAIVNINRGAKVEQKNSGTTGGNNVYTAVGGKGIINIYDGATIVSDKYGVHTMTTGTPVVNIFGGTITAPIALKASTNGASDQLATINVSGGAITGALEEYTVNGHIILTGGTYDRDVNEYCAEYYTAIYDPATARYNVVLSGGVQTRELVEGWSWFSTYIDSETLLRDLKEELNPNGIQIKGQDGYTQFYSGYGTNGAWSPGLTSVSPTKMYMIKTDAAVEVELEGNFVEEDREITLNSGWNWIGYPVRDSVNVKDAIRNIIPTHGDIIKSQTKSLVYNTYLGGWLGDDFYMNPGEGYMYYSYAGQNFDFTYSKETSASSRTLAEPVEYHWIANSSQYPSNMTVIAMLNIDGEVAADNYEVAAFANGECRGSARPFYVEEMDAYVMIMTISGEEVEELTFKCYDVNYGAEYELSNRFNYSSDAILGSFEEPYMFNMNFLNIEESTLDMINIYPNPTTTDRAINLQATCDNVEVFNALGVKVAEYQNVDSIDALETAGVYVIRLTINGEVKNCRLVVK